MCFLVNFAKFLRTPEHPWTTASEGQKGDSLYQFNSLKNAKV